MGGFNIRTKYTGQDKHIQQDRDEKNKLRRQRQDEQNKRGEEEETQYEREYMAEFRQTLKQLKQQQQQQQQQQPQHEEQLPTLTEELFTERLEDMEILTTLEHEQLKDAPWTDATRKRKKASSDNEETQQTIKKKSAINNDILKWILLNRAANLLPAQEPCGEFQYNNLLGLEYFYRDGPVQHTEGYVEDGQPERRLH